MKVSRTKEINFHKTRENSDPMGKETVFYKRQSATLLKVRYFWCLTRLNGKGGFMHLRAPGRLEYGIAGVLLDCTSLFGGSSSHFPYFRLSEFPPIYSVAMKRHVERSGFWILKNSFLFLDVNWWHLIDSSRLFSSPHSSSQKGNPIPRNVKKSVKFRKKKKNDF